MKPRISTDYTKVTGAFLFVGYCVGKYVSAVKSFFCDQSNSRYSIIGPQTFIESEKPQYTSAYTAILIGYCVKTVAVIILYAYMFTANKKRDRQAARAGTMEAELEEEQAIEAGMQDVTELDNKGFRYSL